eukprot:GEMP01023283.1.p1 GENE.GEMP01023283.1~~GEMP01023283.1.p1  ORF type:complete len:428 (+),score=88.95 GEMP01023283.1:67-1350(+)
MGGASSKKKYQRKVDDVADKPKPAKWFSFRGFFSRKKKREIETPKADVVTAEDLELHDLRLSLALTREQLQKQNKLLSSLGFSDGEVGTRLIKDPLERAALMWAQRGRMDPQRVGFIAWRSIVAESLRDQRTSTLKFLMMELNELRKYASPEISVVRKLEAEKHVLTTQVEEFRHRFDEMSAAYHAREHVESAIDARVYCKSSADLPDVVQKEAIVDQAAWNVPPRVIILPNGPPVCLTVGVARHLQFVGTKGLVDQISHLIVEGSANVQVIDTFLPQVSVRRGGRLTLLTCKGGTIDTNTHGTLFVRESEFNCLVGRGAGSISVHLSTLSSIRVFNSTLTLSETRVEGSAITLWVESGRAAVRDCHFMTPSACIACRASQVLLQGCTLAHPDKGVDVWSMGGGNVILEGTQVNWVEQDAFSHVLHA